MTSPQPSPHTNTALNRVRRRQLGLFTRAQAREAGLLPDTLDRWVRTGVVEVRQRGVYVYCGAPDSREQRWLAAALAAGGDAVLARSTAARIHDLPVDGDERIHLLVTQRRLRGLAGVVVHRTRTLPDHHTTRAGPFPVTNVTRTLVDLASELGPHQLRRALGHAVRHGRTDPSRAREVLGEVGRVRGATALRHLLEEISPLDPAARSELESLFLRVTHRGGVPPTAVNHPVTDAHGDRRVLDAVYLPERQPVELDSLRWHGLSLDHHDDTRRANALVLAGWRPPLRYSWWDLTHRPGEVVADITMALQRARREPDQSSGSFTRHIPG